MVPERLGDRGLVERLVARPHDASHQRDLALHRPQPVARGLGGEGEHIVQHAVPPNGKLRRVHADGEATGPGVEVVPREGALMPLVDAARRGEGERMGRDHLAAQEVCAQGLHSEAPVASLEARRLA